MSTVRHGHFEWDPVKAAANVKKHRVSFEEAAGRFLDPHALELADRVRPDRIVLIGYSKDSRVLTVVYAEREEALS
jgi:uncharacterized protein